MEKIITALNIANDYLWTYVVVTMLVGCALFFSIKMRFVQFRMIKDMFRVMCGLDKNDYATLHGDNRSKIGSFQAFAVSLSSRVGTGNLAGVASAIFIGGPGAIFWMWVMAFLGAATAFVEATLAQLFKKKDETSFYGGPAYYMQTGLHKRWMGILFAVLITLTFGMANQVVQSTTLCDALSDTFTVDKTHVGLIMTIATLCIIFGGIRRISNFSTAVVPFMAIGYIFIALYVILTNLSTIPHVVSLIIKSAFGYNQIAGGMIGTTILQGVKRGLFSNEAGEGSAPNAAAIATTSHPIKQGLIQALGVFVDTLVICSCTAFIILISGVYDCGLDGILLTSVAIESQLGVLGKYFLTIAIFLFAYSTIIANYFYGETNIRFITKKKWVVQLFRIFTGLMVMAGAMVSLQTAWSVVDIFMGLMTIVNLIAILLLSKHVFRLLKNYEEQKKIGKEPKFHRSMMPEISSDIECWDEKVCE